MFSSLKSKLRSLVVLPLLMTVSACGDLFMTDVIKRELETSQFRADCELDVNEFSEIMYKNISSQIKCLGENLNIFIKVVKTDKPGYLSREKLEDYIVKNRPEIKPEMVKALKSVFEINYLITGEDPNYISKKSVDKIIDFALVFNTEAAMNFGPIFQNEAPATYNLHLNHRERVSSANKQIVMALRKIFNPYRDGEIHKLNIVDLLESFTTEDTRENVEKIKKLMFAKRVLLGGDKNEITHIELERLLLNLDHLLLIALDGVRYKHIILQQSSLLDLLRRDVNDLYNIINQGSLGNRDTETLFMVEDALEAVKVFVSKDDFDVEKFRDVIIEGKKIVMGGNDWEVKGLEVKNLMNHARSLLQTGTIFHRIYEKFRPAMESHLPVTIDFDDYRHTYPEHLKELEQFERIVKKYRFLKGEFLSAYYFNGHKRNADAIFEVALLEYLLKLVFETYGSPSPNNDAVGGVSMNQEEIQALLKRFEDTLIDSGLILPQNAIATADNISLLGTLFQYQSDKNTVMDVNEATEFAVSLLTSIDMTKQIFNHLKEEKNCALDRFDRLEPECFKNNFWQAFCKDYRTYYPLMFTSLGAPSRCEELVNTEYNVAFLDKSIKAARTCNFYTDGDKEEIWYSESDIMAILLAIVHAETTVLRWDVNENNILDPDEVNSAYEIYSPALDGFLEDKPGIVKKFKKQIYQFLIKYEEIPNEKELGSIWKFIKFLFSFNKKAPATRKTIASVLVAIGEENMKISTGPVFDCNWLRDPENIPRDGEVRTRVAPTSGPDYSFMLEPYLHLAGEK